MDSMVLPPFPFRDEMDDGSLWLRLERRSVYLGRIPNRFEKRKKKKQRRIPTEPIGASEASYRARSISMRIRSERIVLLLPFSSKVEERSASRRIFRLTRTVLSRGISIRLDPALWILHANKTQGFDGMDRRKRNAERDEGGSKERSLRLASFPTPNRSSFRFPREIEEGHVSSKNNLGRRGRMAVLRVEKHPFSCVISSFPFLSAFLSRIESDATKGNDCDPRPLVPTRKEVDHAKSRRRTGTRLRIARVRIPSTRIPRS